jgi:hypothetical protein
MRHRLSAVIAAMALILGSGIAWEGSGRAQAPARAEDAVTAWEYKTVRSTGGLGYETDTSLNAIGKEGWELVSVAVQGPASTL